MLLGTSDDKPTFDRFGEWFRQRFEVELGPKLQKHYDLAAKEMREQIQDCDLWCGLNRSLKEAASEYQLRTQYTLIRKVSYTRSGKYRSVGDFQTPWLMCQGRW